MTDQIRPMIMCGGAGTRLWPTSRNSLPKQFAQLIGERSTFQETVLRLRSRLFSDRPLVLTHRDHCHLVRKQLAEIAVEADIILEPERRDSGPAILAGCIAVAQHDPAQPVLVVASDHLIRYPGTFRRTMRRALAAATSGHLVTFGVPASHPSSDYGYIQPGQPLQANARQVVRFAEKPDGRTAAKYLLDGWLWNSGNFLFQAEALIAEYRMFAPDTVGFVQSAVENGRREDGALGLAAADYARAEKTSIDYAVMERTSRAAVVELTCGWSDIGNWAELWSVSDHDARGNARRGDVELVDSDGCFVSTDGAITSLLGVHDLVVVANRDAILVADRRRCGEVKGIVEVLRSKGRSEAEFHSSVHRPWGSYQVVDTGEQFQVKRITVAPKGCLSLQKHRFRSEHWVVVKGTAKVTVDDDVTIFDENQHVFIPLGAVHRLENPGTIPLELIEIQSGTYLGEDDIVRLEDIYYRA
jgi:mannose-1-phosphate guanylyltransferase/mannose-6-phosphate isomerase